MEITGAIFDFDGTLFDSMHVWKGIRYKFFERIGLKLAKEDEELFKGLFLSESIPFAIKRFNLNKTVDDLYNDLFDYIKELYLVDAVPKNDIIDFLDKLKSKGVKMGIATATGEKALMVLLEKFDMMHYFSAIYSTFTVGASKTEPKVYDVVLDAIGTDKETTWVFEDAVYAATTAKNNGYNVVGIYDKSEPKTDELKNIADIYIHNYSEIDL